MKTVAFAFIILVSFSNLFAQEEPSFKREEIISIVPQYVFQSGIRVDYEFTLKNNRNSWLQLSPELYINTNGNDISNTDYKNMRGIGCEIHHKYFIQEPNDRYGFYFAYGGGLQFYSIKRSENVTYNFNENGAAYISYTRKDVSTSINKVLLNFIVGKKIVRYKPFIMDYYMGVGFRYSMDKNLEIMERFNDSWFDQAYSGSLLVAGLKLGFAFEK